ncbi:chorismate synthase [Metallumcola ferriviriculae]|uniref:chorismate synthase n=1 Tax=Metallumcola ferriviriculae TaxID=3039180 RepID=UPI003458C34F
MLRFLTAGESHGPALTAIIEGLPAKLPVDVGIIDSMLARRQGGHGRGGRMQIETDRVEITAGVRGGFTLGSPVCLNIKNKDWKNWQGIMSAAAEADTEKRVVRRPRPGHADLSGSIKYGHKDMRNVLERSSARETAVRVAVGAVAEQLLGELEIELAAHVVRVGEAAAEKLLPWEQLSAAAASPVYCADPHVSSQMVTAIDRAGAQGDTLGGVFEVRVKGLPVGLGSHVHWDRRLDGMLAQGLMSIQAIKGVEIGLGFESAMLPGSQVHDEIFHGPKRGIFRETNGAGGIEGGITNGEELVVRAAMKPIPTLMQPLRSINMDTKAAEDAAVERSDACAVPAASVVGEAVVAFTLAQSILEHFGGDDLETIKQRWQEWQQYLKSV